MAKSEGEGNWRRNATIATGAGLGLALAGVLTWRVLRGGNKENSPRMVWDVNLDGLDEEAERVASAGIPQFRVRRFGELLGLFRIEAAPYEAGKEMPGSRVAVAVQDRETGLWRAGVAASEEATFGRPEEHPSLRIAAMDLGHPAMESVVLGTANEGVLTAYPTELFEVAPPDDILDAYPGVPIIAGPPR